MDHAELPDAGRVPHLQIDAQLPAPAEKAALAGEPGPPGDANRYLTENHAAGGFGGFANPTASVGLVAVNGVATTAMRSDAAPALSQAIVPTWTGLHTFTVGIHVDSAGSPVLYFDRGAATDSAGIIFMTAGAYDWPFGTRILGGASSDLRLYNTGLATFAQAWEAATGRVVLGASVAAAAQLHIDQASATAAIPVLLLDQADVSEEMIEFVSTVGVGNAIEAVGAKALTTTHFIKVTLPGALTRYFPVGTIA